jgi:hypothetical protein
VLSKVVVIYSQTAPKHSLPLHTNAGPSDEATTLWRVQEDEF